MPKVKNTSGKPLHFYVGKVRAYLDLNAVSEDVPDEIAATLVDVLGCTLVSSESDAERSKAAQAALKSAQRAEGAAQKDVDKGKPGADAALALARADREAAQAVLDSLAG